MTAAVTVAPCPTHDRCTRYVAVCDPCGAPGRPGAKWAATDWHSSEHPSGGDGCWRDASGQAATHDAYRHDRVRIDSLSWSFFPEWT